MKKFGKIVIISMLVMLAFIGIASAGTAVTDPGAPSASDLTPVVRLGNPNCENVIEVGDDSGSFKIEPVESGTYALDGSRSITITVHDTAMGPTFDFTTEGFSLKYVIVKGGPAANVYIYPEPVTADQGLHAPVNPNNDQYYGLSHIEICNFSSNVPEFPAIALPVGMVIGFLGVVTVFRGKE